MKKPIKALILVVSLLIGGYFVTALQESFSGFNTKKLEQNYCTKSQDRFLFFYDESNGQYIDKGTPVFFSYTLDNGKISLYESSQDPFMTLYCVRKGIYYQSKNLYFYPY